jgi:Cu/Ag efflux protein CusF
MQASAMKTLTRLFAFLVLVTTTLAFPQTGVGGGGDLDRPRSGEREFRGAFGEITEISGTTLKIKLRDGSIGTVNTTSDTRFRKERQEAKLSDFKVGDTVAVRGQSSGDKTWTAQVVNLAPSQGEMQARMKEQMGKSIVIGEVKSIDPPKLTVTRTDGVEQTIEADESTSFRKGRGESITMPDIKPGDTIFARGELKNGTFVPSGINVLDPEMAQRIKEGGGMFVMGGGNGGDRRHPPDQSQSAPPASPK